MNITHELRRALQVNSCATTAADAARDMSGQVFGTRMNEIYLFSSPRPIPSLHGAVGWTPEAIAEHTLPALMPLDRSGDAFSLDPLCRSGLARQDGHTSAGVSGSEHAQLCRRG